jgi:hypothetical protein
MIGQEILALFLILIIDKELNCIELRINKME